MRFNAKCAEYVTGTGPLQVRLLGKNSLLSSDAIVDQKMRTIPEVEKILDFKYNCTVRTTLLNY